MIAKITGFFSKNVAGPLAFVSPASAVWTHDFNPRFACLSRLLKYLGGHLKSLKLLRLRHNVGVVLIRSARLSRRVEWILPAKNICARDGRFNFAAQRATRFDDPAYVLRPRVWQSGTIQQVVRKMPEQTHSNERLWCTIRIKRAL